MSIFPSMVKKGIDDELIIYIIIDYYVLCPEVYIIIDYILCILLDETNETNDCVTWNEKI